MNPLRGDTLDALLKDLRAQVKKGGEGVALTTAQAKVLLDELLRLVQSNDRLRRQNRRVRKRLQAATGEEATDDAADDGAEGAESDQDDTV
jgi:regulator of replication initiation timing